VAVEPDAVASRRAGRAIDLSPRTGQVGPAPRVRSRRKGQKVKAGALLAAVLGIGAVVLFQGLSNATTFFCNADEVNVKESCTSDKRFRLQGLVDSGSVERGERSADFTVSYGDATIPVSHRGDPPELFQEGISVVLEGRMVGDTFQSDRIMVKHSEQYKAEYPDRVDPNGP
jgi:cytochrome c-type biogenesis protein CcmE